MGVRQRIQQTGFANVRSATKSDFRSLISGKVIRLCCALDESGGTDFHDWQSQRPESVILARGHSNEFQQRFNASPNPAEGHESLPGVPVISDRRAESRRFVRRRRAAESGARVRATFKTSSMFSTKCTVNSSLNICRNIGEILLIVFRKDDRPDSGSMSRQQLFFDSADRQYFSPKRDFSRHGYIAANRNLSQRAYQGRRHRDSGGRTIFRNCTFWNVNMEIEPTVEIFGNSKHLSPGPHIAHRGLCGFLHDISEFSGQRQRAFAFHQSGFGRQNLTADFGPCKTGYESNFIL